MIQRRRTEDTPNPIWLSVNPDYNYYQNVYKTFMGRDALRIFINNIKTKKVLLPKYICDEVIREFELSEYEIYYYDIENQFKFNKEHINKIIKDNNIEIFYYVVYFGIYSNIDTDFLKKLKELFPNLFLIEDRAHYLSTFHIDLADAIIYSFRKLFPIPEGGGVISSKPLKIEYKNKFLANVLPFLIHLKKRLIGYSDKFTRNNVSITSKKYNKVENIKILPMSYLSKRVLRKIDIEKEIKYRKEAYFAYLKLIEKKILPVFSLIQDCDIPQGCPIFVENPDYIQQEMLKRKFYLKRHWPIYDLELEDLYPNSFYISNHIITLPIYRGISYKTQKELVKNLLEIIK